MALNAEKKSMEIFLRGSTLCVQKINNGEKSLITIPHKNLSNSISEKFFIEKILMYLFGNASQDVEVDISYDAKTYILSCVA